MLTHFKTLSSPRNLNLIGLVFAFVGCLALFFYGAPQPSFARGIAIGLEPATPLSNGQTVAEYNLSQEALENRHWVKSHIGFSLVAVGFGFQLAAAWRAK